MKYFYDQQGDLIQYTHEIPKDAPGISYKIMFMREDLSTWSIDVPLFCYISKITLEFEYPRKEDTMKKKAKKPVKKTVKKGK